MKKTTRILALALALALCFALAACSKTNDSGSGSDAAETAAPDTAVESDLAYVQDKGTLVVGITDFEPMDYKDESGEWVGFDADMARAFAESIGEKRGLHLERHDAHR